METNELHSILDYKNLYYDIKNKYDKLSMELEELKIENKLKDEEINLLRRKLNSNSNLIRLNYLDNKVSSSIKGDENDNNFGDKQMNKKYDTYSIDSFRNDPEQGNDLLQELMKSEINDIKLQKYKNLMKIEKFNFELLSNKINKNTNDKSNNFIGEKNKINRVLTGDIDAILLNIKMKQESLHQTQKMFNLNNDK